nr:cleavage stimulation factor subunit 77 isoform X1 [Ipomoea batatas]
MLLTLYACAQPMLVAACFRCVMVPPIATVVATPDHHRCRALPLPPSHMASHHPPFTPHLNPCLLLHQFHLAIPWLPLSQTYVLEPLETTGRPSCLPTYPYPPLPPVTHRLLSNIDRRLPSIRRPAVATKPSIREARRRPRSSVAAKDIAGNSSAPSLFTAAKDAAAPPHYRIRNLFIWFLRRIEGVEAARKYFLDARKSPNCTYHVYVAQAMIFCLNKDAKDILVTQAVKGVHSSSQGGAPLPLQAVKGVHSAGAASRRSEVIAYMLAFFQLGSLPANIEAHNVDQSERGRLLLEVSLGLARPLLSPRPVALLQLETAALTTAIYTSGGPSNCYFVHLNLRELEKSASGVLFGDGVPTLRDRTSGLIALETAMSCLFSSQSERLRIANPHQVFEQHHFASDGDGLAEVAAGALYQFLENRVVDDVEADQVLAARLTHVHRVEILRRGGAVRVGAVFVGEGVGGGDNDGAGIVNQCYKLMLLPLL